MRTIAVLPVPVNTAMLRVALDQAGPEGSINVEGRGTSHRLVIEAPNLPENTPADPGESGQEPPSATIGANTEDDTPAGAPSL